jgi:hypothetical protein
MMALSMDRAEKDMRAAAEYLVSLADARALEQSDRWQTSALRAHAERVVQRRHIDSVDAHKLVA